MATVQFANRPPVIGSGSRDSLPTNVGKPSKAGSLNWGLKCSVIHAFCLAALQIMHSASAWIISMDHQHGCMKNVHAAMDYCIKVFVLLQ